MVDVMDSSKKTLVILNPVAGKGRAGSRLGEIRGLMDARGLDYDIALTERPGHATELAAAASAYGVVVAAGGDGTVNEVVNGLMLLRESGGRVPALGAFSVGRGNDFAYGADLPSSLEDCVAVLAAGIRRPLDIGRVRGGDYPEGKFFANGMGIGFDTIVGLEAAKMRHVHGAAAYMLGAIKTLLMFPDAPLARIEYDDEAIEQPVQQVSIMNGKRMGGTFFMAPEAENSDGLLNLCVAERLTRRDMVALIGHYTKGTQASHPRIKTMSGARVRISAPGGGLIVHADGETVCVDGRLLDIECLPGALTIVCEPGRVARAKAAPAEAAGSVSAR